MTSLLASLPLDMYDIPCYESVGGVSTADNIFQNFSHTNNKESTLLAVTHVTVLKTKLIIGNVEVHPGPMDAMEYMAHLITKADNKDNVRKVLAEYKSTVERKINIQKMESHKLDDLKETLAYLNNWDQNKNQIKDMFKDLLKAGVIEKIIRRLENILPDGCSTCQKTYYFDVSESSSLRCTRCDRGICPPCLEKENPQLEKLLLLKSSLFFLCSGCVVHVNTEKNLGEMYYSKKCRDKTAKSNISDVSPVSGTNLAEVSADTEKNDNDEPIVIEDEREDEKEDSKKQEKVEKKLPKKKKSNCWFFTELNNCKHGLSGKNCEFTHPKLCAQYCRFGNGKYGCNKAGKCNKFHPKLCNGSVKSRSCFNENCKFTHLKGTRRMEGISNTENTAKPEKNFLGKRQIQTKNPKPPGSGHGSGVNQPQKRKPQNQMPKTQQMSQQPQTLLQNQQMVQQPQTLLQNQQMIQQLLLLLIQNNAIVSSQKNQPQVMNLANPQGSPTWAEMLRNTM